MKAWIAGAVALAGLGGGALFFFTEHSSKKPVTVQDAQGVAELRAEVAQLNRRLGSTEANTTYLTNDVASTRQAMLQRKLEPAPATEPETAATAQPTPPTVEQQMARFEKHFSNLDEQRGKVEDAGLEAKFNTALADTPADLSILKKASVDRVICGNQLCRVEITFPDVANARIGQGQLQAQLAHLSTEFTAYMEPESRHLQAYFATGSAQLPAFPALASETASATNN